MKLLILLGILVMGVVSLSIPAATAGGGCLGQVNVPNSSSTLCASPVSTSSTAQFILSVIEGHSDTVIDAFLLGSPANFGVYADGRFSHTDHDGYRISGTNSDGVRVQDHTAPFGSDEFSVLASAQYDLTKHVNIHDMNLFLGGFGGYAQNRVKIESETTDFGTIPSTSADNDSGVVGAYLLAAAGGSYGLASAAGFFGTTDINDFDVLSGHFDGSYSTTGLVANGVVGHLFKLDEHVSFDIRSGLSYVDFRGDSFAASSGEAFPQTEDSALFANVGLGLIGNVNVGEMRLKPYARGGISQRIFDERDAANLSFSADDGTQFSISGGLFTNVSASLELNGEVSGTFSNDSDTIAGKLALKYSLN